MKFSLNSQEENCITPHISGVNEKNEERMNMVRKAVNLLPSTERSLEKVGANIKRARLRRNIHAELLAERAGISADTLSSIEKGVCTVSIGAYAAVLASLGMEKDIELLGADEEQKRRYREFNLKMRKRATKKTQEK